MSSMSNWFILTIKWGGAAMTILFSAALIYVTYVTETENALLKSAYWGFIAMGLALTVAGYRWERKYLQGDE